jgi:hypothetical protein
MARQTPLSYMQDVDRSNVAGVRKALSALGAVVAEVDRQLRYVWIDNPHPDFDAKSAIGKRDDELISKADAEEIMSLKRDTFARGAPMARILAFKRSDGLRYYSLFAYPIRQGSGKLDTILTVGFDMPAPAKGGNDVPSRGERR